MASSSNLMHAAQSGMPFISVVIPAYNEGKNIRRCIQSILSGSYPKDRLEIIVVDNGSADGTVGAARDCGARVIEMPGASIAQMRNRGARESRGGIIAYIDGDCAAHPDWLHHGLESLRSEPCITGARIEVPEGANWIESAWFSFRPRGRYEASHINTSNLFVERALFEALGGFNEALRTGEDTEFSARAKQRVKVIDDNRIRVVHYGNPRTLRAFIKREIWHGLGAFGSFKVDWFDKPLLGTFAFIILTLSQAAGLAVWAAGGRSGLFTASTACVFLLLLATVVYRRRMLTGIRQAVHSLVLYYFYYLARSISFFFLLTRRNYYHSIK